MHNELSCFVISPIGELGSDIRNDANYVLKKLIKQTLIRCGFREENIVRADEREKPGRITEDVMELLICSDLCIVDLTGLNPNVMYEFGIRYNIGRPFLLLVKEGHKLPFDVADIRAIKYDLSSEEAVEKSCETLKNNIKYLLNADFSNPLLAGPKKNVLMLPRSTLHSLPCYTIDKRLQISSGIFRQIKKIRLLNFGSNLFLNPQYGDFAHVRQLEEEPISLKDAIDRIMKNTTAHLEIILSRPTTSNLHDAKTKIANRRLGYDGVIYSAFSTLNEMMTTDTLYRSLHQYPNQRFGYFAVDISIPFAIFNVEYKEGYEQFSHVKVDLYSSELEDEDERRSMLIWRQEDQQNYEFFVNNFNSIRRGSNCKKPSRKELSEWALAWKGIEASRKVD